MYRILIIGCVLSCGAPRGRRRRAPRRRVAGRAAPISNVYVYIYIYIYIERERQIHSEYSALRGTKGVPRNGV